VFTANPVLAEEHVPHTTRVLTPFIITQDPDPTSRGVLRPSLVILEGIEGIGLMREVVHGRVA
jgi:hypothetical protein